MNYTVNDAILVQVHDTMVNTLRKQPELIEEGLTPVEYMERAVSASFMTLRMALISGMFDAKT